MSLSLFFPLILAYMAKAGTGADTTEHYLQTRFDYVYTMMLGYGLVFLLPCLIGIIAAILFFIERDCDTSKNLRTIPVTNTQLIMAKISMLFIFSIAFCLTSTLSVALFCKLFHVGMVYGMTYKIFMSLIFGVLIVAASLPIVFLIICFNKSFLLSILLAFFYSIFTTLHRSDIDPVNFLRTCPKYVSSIRRNTMTVGHVHSIESMGLVDGPGIRTVIFLQGCALRCRFCHNPDTWELSDGTEYTPEELVAKIRRFKPYFKEDGGVTFSGGEPLLQPDFLKETLKLCKNEGIHTCIDTAGYGLSDYDEILNHTDLVLLDLKHIHKTDYEKMTGRSMDRFEEFLNALKKHQTKIWIRHVVVPGITDSENHMAQLKAYIQTIPNVEKVELLPYHLLGTNKYKVMNIPYSLEGVPAMDKKKTEMLQQTYFDHVYFMEEKSC